MAYAIVDLDKCTGEARCVDVCPNEALSIGNSIYEWGGKCVVNENECLGCEACIDECPNGALSMLEE